MINNAAVLYRGNNYDDLMPKNDYWPSKNDAHSTIKINFTETVNFTEEMLPYLTSDAKIIQLSSYMGKLMHHSKEVQ